MGEKHLIACKYCDLLIASGGAMHVLRYRATCPRCGGSLFRAKGNTLSLSLSLTVAAGLLVLPAFTTPIFILTSMGNVRTNTMFTGVVELFVQGLWDVALLVLITSILFPICKVLSLLYTLIGITSGYLLPCTGCVFRWYHYLKEWAMLDVFVLGVMVALTKLDTFADVNLGLGFWALCVMLTFSTGAGFFLDEKLAWQEIERLT